MILRRLILLGFAAALPAAFGCSNSDSGSPAAFTCTDGGAPAADTVVMKCGGATSSSTQKIDIVIGGTASGTTTLRGLNFDVTYATSKLQFVDSGTYTSPLFPNALIAVTLFNNQPGRVVVSIQQPGTEPDIPVPAGESTVLSLSFGLATGTSFAPSALLFDNTAATAESVPINFTSALALSY